MRLPILGLVVLGFGCLSACGSPEQIAYPPPAPRAVTVPEPSHANFSCCTREAGCKPRHSLSIMRRPTPQPNGTRYPATPTMKIRPGYPPPTPVDTPTPCPTPITNPTGPRALAMVNPTLKFSGNPGSYRPPRVALLPSAILRFFDASTGIGVSEPMRAVNAHDRGILLKTTDGGQTWTQVRKLDEFAYGVFISFINQRIGYLAGSGRLWITHDGGITLEEVGRFPWNTGGIDFATADVGLYTNNNQIYRTNDGGKT